MSRTHLFTLLQARNPSDPAREDEHLAFADKLGVSVSDILAVDVLTERLDDRLLDGSHAMLVGGSGEYSVLDDVAPIQRLIDFLAHVSESGHPMFASCFGFQALAVGLGGSVVHDEDNAEVGTYDLRLTDSARQDPIFRDLPAGFKAQLGHKDQVDRLPAACVNLASSDRTPNQAYRVEGRPVYATQFHPELSHLENRARFERYYEEYGRVFGEEAARAQLEGHVPSPEANTLLLRFARHFVPEAVARAGEGA